MAPPLRISAAVATVAVVAAAIVDVFLEES